MNLIEELGGYEKAKGVAEDDFFKGFTHVSLDGKRGINDDFSFIPHLKEALKEMVRISDIKESLLEYRRANNIFEVGDKVVYLDEPILRCVTEVKTIKCVGGKSVWAYSGDRYDFATEVYFNQFRHATDEEIKAGHRL